MSLADLGLHARATVRFQRAPGGRWLEGHCLGVNKDGSIDLVVAGRIRAIQPERLEIKTRGPRGGAVWIPLTPNGPVSSLEESS